MTITDERIALLPCPFCGGEAKLWGCANAMGGMDCCVQCPACDFSLENVATPALAAAAWNRRSRSDGVEPVAAGWFWRWASSDEWRMLGASTTEAGRADFIRDQEKIAPVVVARLYASPSEPVREGWRDVLAERRRQVEVEGWTAEHDDEHETGQMASAAACYASPEDFRTKEVPHSWSDDSRYMDAISEPLGRVPVPAAWPWDGQWWKPSKDQRRNLVKAGALILAEIERLDRLAAAAPSAPNEGGRRG